MAERPAEKFVNRVLRLRPQAPQDPLAEALSFRPQPVQEIGEEGKGRRHADRRQDLAQNRFRLGQARIACVLQCAPDGGVFLARVAEIEQGVVIDGRRIGVAGMEEGAFEGFAQRQIVLGQQGEPRQRQQVAHGLLPGQFQAVRAGHLHARALQLTDHLIEEAAAPPHQDHHVPGVGGAIAPPALPDLQPVIQPGFHARRDLARQPFLRIVRAWRIHRGPGIFLHRLGRHRRGGPQLHRAAAFFPVGAAGHVAGNIPARRPVRQQGGGGFPVKHRVHALQDGGGGAEGGLHRNLFGAPPGMGGEADIILRLFQEFRRLGALEGIDGLFLVADGKQGLVQLRRPFAREEFLGQGVDQLPLVGGGVLRLVDQDVVDAAIQLVTHPFARVRQGQELARMFDQVGEIQRPHQTLAAFERGDHHVRQRIDARRQLRAVHPGQPVARHQKAFGDRAGGVAIAEQIADLRTGFPRALGSDAPRGHVAAAGQAGGQQGFEGGVRVRRGEQRVQRLGAFDIRLAAGAER